MKRNLREQRTSLNLIKPSPLRVIFTLIISGVCITAFVLLMSLLFWFVPSAGALANAERTQLVRTEQQDHPDAMLVLRAQHPENQIDTGVNFFYLDTSPGLEQTISVTLENRTDEYQTVEVAIHLATTDNQGNINYWGTDEPPDATLPHNIEDLVDFESHIQLAPNETEEFSMNIRMPTTPYQGVLAGGLTFTLVDHPLQSFIMALFLRQDGDVESQLLLADVTAEVVGGQSVITANLRNIVPTFMGRMRITTEVRDSAGELVFTDLREDLFMAPNSSFLFEVGLNGLEMTDEMYEITYIIEHAEERWELTWPQLQGTGTFVEEHQQELAPEPIVDGQAEEEVLPEPPAMLDEDNLHNLFLLLIVIAGIFILVMIIVSIVLKRKAKAENFEEIQRQILATLMDDEEVDLGQIEEEKQIPKRAIVEKRNDKTLDELEKIIDEIENDSQREKASDKGEKKSEVKVKSSLSRGKATTDKKEKDIEKKVREIARKQRELDNIEKTLKAKEKTIEEKAKTVEEKEKTVEEKEKTVEEKEKTVEEKAKTVEEKQKEFEKKEKQRKEILERKVQTYERKKEEWEIDI